MFRSLLEHKPKNKNIESLKNKLIVLYYKIYSLHYTHRIRWLRKVTTYYGRCTVKCGKEG